MAEVLAQCKKISSIAIYAMRQRLQSPRVICVMVLLTLFVWDEVSAVGEYAGNMGVRVNALLYPFFSADCLNQLVVFSAVLACFVDAPFIGRTQPYIIIRSKRITWIMGQILHIIIFCALFFAIVMLLSVIVLLPNGTLATDGWGQVVTSIAKYGAGEEFFTLIFSRNITQYFSPIEAFVLCFALNWGMAAFLGVLMFAVSMCSSRKIAVILGGAIVYFDLMVYNNYSFSFRYFSPLSVSRISELDLEGISKSPDLWYPFVLYGVGIAVMSVITILSGKRKPVEITAEL